MCAQECVTACVHWQREREREGDHHAVNDRARCRGERRSVKKLSTLPIWKASPPNEVVQNHPIDNKANFYGSDKYVIMCSGAFQILSQSINYHANFIPVLTYLHGNIRFGGN